MLKTKTNIFTLLLCSSFAFAQNSYNETGLSPTIAYVDADKDGLITLNEAYGVFDLYVNNTDHRLHNDLTRDVENTVIELISYLEGIPCNDIKNTPAAQRFIELYYLNKFNPKIDESFGMPLGFTGPDSVPAKESIIPVQKSQTAFFDNYFTIGAQLTSVTQQGFISAPLAENSGGPSLADNRATLVVATIPIEFKPWRNGTFNFTPEYAGGAGVHEGAGYGGYPNALFGYPQMFPYLLRAQFQQSFPSKKEDAFIKEFGFTFGKFVLQEVFSCNAYAGDPKKDFLNFNHTMLSAWDAATTAYGFTYGGALKVDFRNSQFNAALVTVDKDAGGTLPGWNVLEGHSLNLQYARNFSIGEQNGTIRGLTYYNKAYSGNFNHYLLDSLGGSAYFDDSLKAYRGKYGFGIDMDFALTDNLGFFARYSWNDGKSESMGYTQADRAYNAGFAYSFGKFKRPNDLFGISASVNELSAQHQDFLKHGGTGFMVGDGSLNYRKEMVAEVFYRINLIRYVELSLNYQYIMNSAYNFDRGNAHFLACRLNFEF